MQLIVCEKPSAAKDFAAALDAKWNKDTNAWTSPNYCIVAMRGHLLGLRGLRETDERFQQKWDEGTLAKLPVFPDFKSKFMYEEKEPALIKSIKKHLLDSAVTHVINACDPGREGELLFWELFDYCGCNKPVSRFWESQALAPDIVKRGLSSLRQRDFFTPRRSAAYARQQADWIVGMNLTIGYTAKSGTLYTVGPVQTPVLALIVRRDEAIERWTKTTYAELHAPFRGYIAKYLPAEPVDTDRPHRINMDAVPGLVARFEHVKEGIVDSVERKETPVAPPKLYSLTTLQVAANRKHGFSAKKTLSIAQKLYEEYKCLSYPRTDSEVIGEDMVDQVHEIAARMRPHYQNPDLGIHITKRNTNNAELTDHHALLPLKPIPENAAADEKVLHQLVLERFFQAFAPGGKDLRVQVRFDIAGESFLASARTIQEPGWRSLRTANDLSEDDGTTDEKEENAPLDALDLAKGQTVVLDKAIHAVEKELQPPKHYTEADLLKAMENAANFVEDQELRRAMKDVGGRLGTPATQDSIIELLIRREYVERKKKLILSTPLGRQLIQTVHESLTDVAQRAVMEKMLNDFQNPDSSREYIQDIMQLVKDNIAYCRDLSVEQTTMHVPDAVCPKCQSVLLERPKFYGCASCDFSLPRVYGAYTLSHADVQTLAKGQPTEIHTFKNRDGSKTFPASLMIQDDGRLGYSFPDRTELTLGTCPSCGKGKIYPKNQAVCACTNCDYVLWRTVAGVKLTESQITKLLKDKKLGTIKGFQKKGNSDTFAAGLELKPDGKVGFAFSQNKPSSKATSTTGRK
ncbi:type IA DNA topoisomerase [Alicyclobacillus mengziensis]|uniref:DNA topoisomerase n=1 Tax=Alicyclobacillus mengziensis TaxID=2931921 RepID=A0A9X7W409_9BACL|nr:type IA DNA topoisomerase [Alicyclobacillus mengziensis]QSO50107.1 topoisomerase C-terminal repeat-containing protein [Alicyclobacillus mengziensis]